MDDLISRQGAIYAIEKRMDAITCEEFAEGMSEAIIEISLLPSVHRELIRCKDCKYRVRREGNERFTHEAYYCGYEYERCDPYEMTRNANDPNYFCGDAKRRNDV